jgi:hypothetical protein
VRRWLRIVAWSVAGLLLLVGVAAVAFYRASQHVPEFYQKAVEVEPAKQQAASQVMIKRATDLASDVQKSGRWQATFTEDEVNGWLAVDLVKNHPGALPGTISNPRVAITPQGITAACRYRDGRINAVLSLSVDAYLEGPNVVALRVRRARAGALPLPLDDVLKQIARATDRLEWRIEWRQADGDPVALVTIPPPRDKRRRVVELDTLRLGDGEIQVAGTTRPQ